MSGGWLWFPVTLKTCLSNIPLALHFLLHRRQRHKRNVSPVETPWLMLCLLYKYPLWMIVNPPRRFLVNLYSETKINGVRKFSQTYKFIYNIYCIFKADDYGSELFWNDQFRLTKLWRCMCESADISTNE